MEILTIKSSALKITIKKGVIMLPTPPEDCTEKPYLLWVKDPKADRELISEKGEKIISPTNSQR